MTDEQRRISDRNRYLTWKHFYPEGKGKAKKGYHLHHVDKTLRHNDIERYIQWNPEDLVMLTSAEHQSLHHKGQKFSEESRRKMSEAHKGVPLSEETRRKMSEVHKGLNTWMTGRRLSDETRHKMSESHKGKGHPISEETRKKISETLKRRHKNEQS